MVYGCVSTKATVSFCWQSSEINTQWRQERNQYSPQRRTQPALNLVAGSVSTARPYPVCKLPWHFCHNGEWLYLLGFVYLYVWSAVKTCESGKAVEKVAQGGCTVFIFGDSQKLTGRSPGSSQCYSSVITSAYAAITNSHKALWRISTIKCWKGELRGIIPPLFQNKHCGASWDGIKSHWHGKCAKD